MNRVRRIVKFCFLAVVIYLITGAILHETLLSEDELDPQAYLDVGTILESRAEGFLQVVTRMEADRIWTRLVLEPQAPGPPEHVHSGFAEVFQVTEGTLSVLYDGEVRQVRAGEELEIPAGVRHKPFNPSNRSVVVEGEKGWLPARFGLFLQQVYGFFNEHPANSRPPRALLQMSLFSPRYDSWLAGPPVLLQRAFFFILAPTARLFGYRSFYEEYALPESGQG